MKTVLWKRHVQVLEHLRIFNIFKICDNDLGEDDDQNSEINNDGKIYIFYGYLVPAVLIAIFGCLWIYITCARILEPIRESHR